MQPSNVHGYNMMKRDAAKSIRKNIGQEKAPLRAPADLMKNLPSLPITKDERKLPNCSVETGVQSLEGRENSNEHMAMQRTKTSLKASCSSPADTSYEYDSGSEISTAEKCGLTKIKLGEATIVNLAKRK